VRSVALVAIVALGCGAQMPNAHIAPAGNAPAAPDQPGRKVIDIVFLELRVDSVQTTASQLAAAVATAGGYIADSQVRLSNRTARWTVRVPSERLEPFLAEARSWGVVLSSRATAEDVTEQFIDVEARQKAKRLEEERLLKLLEEGTGSLADVLAVEQQLQRVREEIERTEGRLRYLEHATTFATVHIDARELVGVSWSAGEPLGTQSLRVFRDSWSLLVLCGRGAVLVAAALTPWLGVAAIVLCPVWWLWRRRRQREYVTVDVKPT
jgi:hypothetical protein